MVELSFRTLLMAAVGGAPLTKPRLGAACDAAIPLSAIAARAEEKAGATFFAHAEPKFEDYFVTGRHPSSQRDWTTAVAPWQCNTSLFGCLSLRRLPTRGPAAYDGCAPQVASRLRCHLTLFEQDDD